MRRMSLALVKKNELQAAEIYSLLVSFLKEKSIKYVCFTDV